MKKSCNNMSLSSVSYGREYFMQDNVCRLCWRNTAYTPLGLNKSSLKSSVTENIIRKQIRECLDIDLSFSDNPNKICDVCYIQISKFYDFKKSCKEYNRKLRKIFEEEPINPCKLEKTQQDTEFVKVIDEQIHHHDKNKMSDDKLSDLEPVYDSDNEIFKQSSPESFKCHNDSVYEHTKKSLSNTIEHGNVQHCENSKNNNNSVEHTSNFINQCGKTSLSNSIEQLSDSINQFDNFLPNLKNPNDSYESYKKLSLDYIDHCNDLQNECAENSLYDSIEHVNDSVHKCTTISLSDSIEQLNSVDKCAEKSLFDAIDPPNNHEYKIFKKSQTNCIENSHNSEHDYAIKSAKSLKRTVIIFDLKPDQQECKQRTPTYCNICCLDLCDNVTLEEHRAQEHGIENGLYKCFGCEKRFKSLNLRPGHEKNFCKGLGNGYKCELCENYMPSRRKLEQHRRNHRNNSLKDVPQDIFKCSHCDRVFGNRDMLKKHMRDIGHKRYVCETCGRIFVRQDYLSKHMQTHSGERRHACTYCDFRAVQKTALNIHIRKHTGERPFQCDACPQRCATSSNLIMHKRIHLKLKQFECKDCHKRFGYQRSLEEHVARVHEAPKHICECGAACRSLRDLRKHHAAKHNT